METFSLIDTDEVASPSVPEGPLINGLVSSTLLTETVRVWSEVLLAASVALTTTT